MKTLTHIVILTVVLLVFSGCVRRTIYTQNGRAASSYNSSDVTPKATSSKILWFWNKDFWSQK